MTEAIGGAAPAEGDAEVLAGLLVRRRSRWRGVLAALWAVLAVAQVAQGNAVLGVLWCLQALLWGTAWWAGPQPRLQELTDSALEVRQGLRTRSLARSAIEDVRPKYGSGYGLVLTVRDTDPIVLLGTALRFSVAAAQAGALRRWAGLAEEPTVS